MDLCLQKRCFRTNDPLLKRRRPRPSRKAKSGASSFGCKAVGSEWTRGGGWGTASFLTLRSPPSIALRDACQDRQGVVRSDLEAFDAGAKVQNVSKQRVRECIGGSVLRSVRRREQGVAPAERRRQPGADHRQVADGVTEVRMRKTRAHLVQRRRSAAVLHSHERGGVGGKTARRLRTGNAGDVADGVGINGPVAHGLGGVSEQK